LVQDAHDHVLAVDRRQGRYAQVDGLALHLDLSISKL
jgi:hypothetical protein